MRLDLLSKYEEQSCLQEILLLITPHIRELFHCLQVITKCGQEAVIRKAVLLDMGFSPSKELLICWDDRFIKAIICESYRRSKLKNVYTGIDGELCIFIFFILS